MLGIIIGVFAVIAMVAVGQGAQAVVQGAFSSMGSNMLVVMSGASKQGGAFGGFGSQPTLTWDDLKAIRREVPSVRFASAVLRANVATAERRSQLEYGRERRVARILRHPRLADDKRRALHPVGRGHRAKSGRARSDGRRPPLRAARVARGPDGANQGRPVSDRGRAGQEGPIRAGTGQRRCRVRPGDDVSIENPEGAAAVHPGDAHGGRDVASGHASRATADHRPAARSASPGTRRRRGLFDSGSDRDHRRRDRRNRRPGRAARRHRGRVVARGRHRHHEHHAGQRHGANARDWSADGGRRQGSNHPRAVSDRIRGALRRRRGHWDRPRPRHGEARRAAVRAWPCRSISS